MTTCQSRERNDFFACSDLERLRVVRVPLDRFCFGHVEVVLPQREAIRSIKMFDQLSSRRGLARRHHVDDPILRARSRRSNRRGFLSAATVGHEHLAVRPLEHEPGRRESFSPDVDGESLRDVELRTGRSWNQLWLIPDGSSRIWLWQFFRTLAR